jgi:hypothetical protein
VGTLSGSCRTCAFCERHVGLVYGTDKGWTLLAAASSIPVALWCLGYSRRRTRWERVLMTNALVTDRAHAYARSSRIRVVDRAALQDGMCLVRIGLRRRRVRGMNLVSLVMAGVLCSAVVAIGIVADQIAAHPHSASSAPDVSYAVPARSFSAGRC